MPAATHPRQKALPLLPCPPKRAGLLSLRLMMTAWLQDKLDHSAIHRPRERTWVSFSTCTRSTGTRLAFPGAENLHFGRHTLPAVHFCCLHSYIGMSQRKVFDLNPLHEFHPETIPRCRKSFKIPISPCSSPPGAARDTPPIRAPRQCSPGCDETPRMTYAPPDSRPANIACAVRH